MEEKITYRRPDGKECNAYYAIPAAAETAQVDALESRLKAGKVNYEFYRYQAQLGFGNETGEHHDPEATQLAWQRTLDFLAKHIK